MTTRDSRHRVLVTGAGGFIGRRRLPMLVERGFEVPAIGSRQRLPSSNGVRWHHVDMHGGGDGVLRGFLV